MSSPELETVPNFSEGRDWDVIEELVDAFKETDGVSYLDLHLDEDHNRSVITAAGPADRLQTALVDAVGVAVENIDLSEHEGTHPFMGAADVIPFVPIDRSTMEDATRTARELAERLSDRYNLPVFLYANAASRDHTRKLASLRNLTPDELQKRMREDEAWKPDFGPDQLHPKSGLTAVGSRDFLIAMNVDLLTSDPEDVHRIAREVRESSGGLTGIQALGMNLENQGRMTVSTNITDFRKTSPQELVTAIHEKAEAYGIKPGPTELVGLIPEEAVRDGTPDELNIPRFDPERHVFEKRLKTVRKKNGSESETGTSAS